MKIKYFEMYLGSGFADTLMGKMDGLQTIAVP